MLKKYKVPLVGVFSGSDAIRAPGSENIFHTRASYNDEIMKIARLLSTLGLHRVAVLYQDDGFGAAIMKSVAKASDEFKFDVVAKVAYKPGEKDFHAQAGQIIAANSQAGAHPTPEQVLQSLTSMRNYRLAGFPIDFSETNRKGSSYMDIAVIGRNARLLY